MISRLAAVALAGCAVMSAHQASAAAFVTNVTPGMSTPTERFVLTGPGNPFTGLDPLEASIFRRVNGGGSYTDNFKFTIGGFPPGAAPGNPIGTGGGSLTYIIRPSAGVTFSSITFFNGLGTVNVPINNLGAFIAAGLNNVKILAGQENVLSVNWSTEGVAQYDGNIEFTPGGVPEPMTWAMMIIGFAAVGFGMRRRNQEVARVRYAF